MGLKIALLGATGALGKQVLRALEKTPFEIEQLLPVASLATRTPHVEFRGQEMPVLATELVELADAADVVINAAPPEVAREVLAPAMAAGIAIVDLGGGWADADDVPAVAPWANPYDLERILNRGVVRSPGPLALALAAILQPMLKQEGLVGAWGNALLPAGAAGRDGIEELSSQVVSMFNSRTPPQSVFPEGLAFDLIPQWGTRMADGWTALERQAARDLGLVTGFDKAAISVTIAPIFAGMGLSLHVIPKGLLEVDEVRKLYEDAPKIQLYGRALRPLMPRANLDRSRVAVGRLRADPVGFGFHLWAAADPLRLVASNAVELIATLIDEGRL